MTTNQPERFGKYAVIELLGEGGFAHVYLVEDENGERWALKHIHEDLIQKDPHYQEQFAREANIQKKLRHDHIVAVHDFSAEEGYLVLDYVEGSETLKAFVERVYPDGMNLNYGKDLDTVFQIFEPLADALTYIHNRDNTRPNLAHLDITPKNILIQEIQNQRGETAWNVRLADFGLARMVDLDGHAKGGASRWGAGTLGFMAPEQEHPHVGIPGVGSDIYSLGLLIGFMLTGRQTGPEIIEILHETNNTALPPMLPLEVKRVLQRATDKIPDHRYANVQGLVRAFTQAVKALYQAQGHQGEQGETPTVSLVYGRETPTVQLVYGRETGQTNPGRPPIDPPPTPSVQNSAGGLKKKIIIGGAIVVPWVLLLVLIVWRIILPALQPYPILLGGLDLNSYCQTYGYNEVTADASFCTSNLDMTAACRWANPSQSNAIAKNSNSTNPDTWYCYTPQNSKLGGLSSLPKYCQSPPRLGVSTAKPQDNGTNQWICEQQVNQTRACIWQFDRTDVQARKTEGLWNCYGQS